MDEAVCEICGRSEKQEVMVKCAQCNACQHRYCLEAVLFEMEGDWYCYDCKKKTSGDQKSLQGKQTPILDNDPRTLVHQNCLKTPQHCEKSKVKFIPCEDAALLSKARQPAYKRQNFVVRHTHRRQVRPASPGNVKQIRPTSPRSMKQPLSIKCVSPSRGEAQVFASTRCAVASQNLVKIDDVNMRQEIQSGATTPLGHHIQNGPSKKVASEDKVQVNSQLEDNPRRKTAFDTSDSDIGYQYRMKSLHPKIDMPVIISSSAEYARRPPPEAICWTGCFHVSDGVNRNLGKFKAYYPSKVSSKVCDIAKKMPNNILLEIIPRMNHWPMRFERIHPVYEDIGLLFFSSELDSCEMKYPQFLEAYCSFVMKACIDDTMLLIYSSEVLPPDSQWIDGELYLWGVFVKSNRKSNRALFHSTAP